MMQSEQTSICTNNNSGNSIKKESTLKFCIHCSNPCSYFNEDDDETFEDFIMGTADFQSSSTISSSSARETLSKALHSIFKLNYINAFDSFKDDQVHEDDLTLCQGCNTILNNLYQLYNDFLVLGKIDSYLKKKLERLDGIIDCHQQKSINCDFIIGGEEVAKYGDISLTQYNKSPNGNQKMPVQRSRRASENKSLPKNNKNVKSTSTTTTICDREPRIILKRLPEKYSRETSVPFSRKSVGTDDVLSDVPSPPDNYDDDDDYRDSPHVVEEEIEQEDSSDNNIDASEFPLYNPKSSLNKRKYRKRSKTGQVDGDKPKRGRGRPRKNGSTNRKKSKSEPKLDKESRQEKNRLQKMRNRDQNIAYLAKKVTFANPCWYCDQTDFPTPADVLEHTRNLHLSQFNEAPSPVVCERCSKILCNGKALSCHLKKCELIPFGARIEKTIPCSQCPKVFANAKALRSHIRCHTDERPFACDECPYRAKMAATLRVHKQVRHLPAGQEAIDESVQCDVCGKVLKNAKLLRSHKRYMHTEEGSIKYRGWKADVAAKKKEERMAIVKPTSCTECSVDLYSRLAYINHRREFHGDNMGKQHICHICGKDFHRAHSLTLHNRRVHSDERPFVCETCGKAFKRNDNLKAHFEQTHTEEGRLKYNERMRDRHRRMKIRARQLENAKLQQIRAVYPNAEQPSLGQQNNLHLGESSSSAGGAGGGGVDFWQTNI